MNKSEFVVQLFEALGDISFFEKEKISQYYEELLLDKMEEGMTEEEAVKSFGTPCEAAEFIMEELEESRIVSRARSEEESKSGQAPLQETAENGMCVQTECVDGVLAQTEYIEGTSAKIKYADGTTEEILVEEAGINAFDIEVKNATVKVYSSQDARFRIRYLRDKDVKVEYARKGNCFVLRERSVESGRLKFRSFFGLGQEKEMSVEVPGGFLERFVVKTSNASVKLSDICLWYNGEIRTTNGKISLDHCRQGDLLARTTNSKILLSGCNMWQVDAVSTNNKVTAEDCRFEMLNLGTTNGKVSAERVDAKEIQLHTTNGSIALDKVAAARLNLSTTNAPIVGNVYGNMADYNIACSTTNGSCNLPIQRNVESCKELNAHTTNGSIHVEFVE